MVNSIQGFLIASNTELERAEQIKSLTSLLPQLTMVEAIYPAHQKIPFKQSLMDCSFKLTGHALSNGELGCLLSHRKVWQTIVSNQHQPNQMYLVLESDSSIVSMHQLVQQFEPMEKRFDLFFWGAWEGHMKLFRSTKQEKEEGFIYGKPLLKSVYCTYGYSLNKKAAKLLLERTKKIAYPVDQFKKMIREDELRVGGAKKEVISTIGKRQSYIQQNRNHFKEFFWWLLLDFKNSIICFFK
jgi:GR25 family glycosyltransferase involved in LPS biosynthesis